ncbi:hypothetical protein FE392_19850 [Xenorhabdus sp. 12]|uniref:Uncharacterized protein n=1 Tax=Xenorhabdus santafensis TaxID=2582833 RepID=A0ABU4SFE1_9GAMM|nr:hypothetical protein [Xenorhabdus sp. 12]MDX7989508.1 hypothetical protein [Xenorhabdus sp. 12]
MNWIPSVEIELLNIINDNGIKALPIGSSEELILKTLGEPELPRARFSKKSKIITHLYGNLSVLSENGTIIAIDIDFKGEKTEVVKKGEISCWGINQWVNLSEKKKWTVDKLNDVININSGKLNIGLSINGEVNLISIR